MAAVVPIFASQVYGLRAAAAAAANSAVAAHEAEADPHPAYLTETDLAQQLAAIQQELRALHLMLAAAFGVQPILDHTI